MEYLLKVSTLIILFYLCYRLFLERETFFNWNRWFLLMGLVTALFLPFIIIPVYVDYTAPALDNFEICESANYIKDEGGFDFFQFILVIYLVGVLFFALRFLINLFSLIRLILSNKSSKIDKFTIVQTTEDVFPFSFFNWIVYNPAQFNKQELEQIIDHEKVHSQEQHSFDILLSQMCCVLLWFNPFIWLYNRDLKQNLEFIADKGATNTDKCLKSYQYTLLKISMPNHQLVLSNPFYNSLIKKRIVMLHKSKSKKINALKYLTIVPILAWFLMSFSTKTIFIEHKNPIKDFPATVSSKDGVPVETISKEEPIAEIENATIKTSQNNRMVGCANTGSNTAKAPIVNDLIIGVVNDNSTEADLDNIVTQFKEHGIIVKFKGIKRNSEGLITSIKIVAEAKNANANFNLNSDESISPIRISYNKESNNISIGSMTAKNCTSAHACSNKTACKKHCDKNKHANVITDNNSTYATTYNYNRTGHTCAIKSASNSQNATYVMATANSDNNSTVIFTSNNDSESEPIYILNCKKVS